MQLQTILQRVQKHKSFVYRKVVWRTTESGLALDVRIEPRANGKPLRSCCGRKHPGYDRLRGRRYQFAPLWGIACFFLHAPRRVDCPRCGIKVEQVLPEPELTHEFC
jgi:hypothetical protein